jgi:hypothetical protein
MLQHHGTLEGLRADEHARGGTRPVPGSCSRRRYDDPGFVERRKRGLEKPGDVRPGRVI